MVRRGRSQQLEYWPHQPHPVERMLGVWLIGAGITQATRGYWTGPRAVNAHVVHVVLDGALEVTTARTRTTHVHAGDLFCLFPGVRHSYGPRDDQAPPRMMWVSLAGPSAATLMAELSVAPEEPIGHGFVPELFLRHLPLFRTAGDDRRSSLRPLLQLEYLVRFLGEVVGQTGAPGRGSASGSDWVHAGRALMDDHYRHGITVAEVAQCLNLDRTHFTRLFAREAGETPARYLRRRRLEEGQRLLRTADLTVAEVARQVGYGEPSAFSRAFRAHFGHPPSAEPDRG